MGDDKAIERDVKAGKLDIMEWGGELLTVIEKQGPEMVICCCVGKNVAGYMHKWYRLAKRNDCTAIRFHTKRRGLARMGSEYSPVLIGRDSHRQYVYLIEVR